MKYKDITILICLNAMIFLFFCKKETKENDNAKINNLNKEGGMQEAFQFKEEKTPSKKEK